MHHIIVCHPVYNILSVTQNITTQVKLNTFNQALNNFFNLVIIPLQTEKN